MKVQNYLLAAALACSAAACSTAPSPSALAATVGTGTFVSADGVSINAVYSNNDTVLLTFGDRSTKTLMQAASGSGTRYVSGTSEWWEHQGEATYAVDGKRVFVGKRR